MTVPPPEHKAADAQLRAPNPPLDGFSPEEFRCRRRALREALPEGLIVMRGAAEDEFAFAGAGPFRQRSDFFYLTGVSTPGAVLTLLPEELPATAGLRDIAPETREILFLPDRSAATEAWTGPKLGPAKETESATGISRAISAGQLKTALIGWLRRCPVIYTAMPFGERARLSRDYAFVEEILSVAPVAQFRDISYMLSTLRLVKTEAELERIRLAVTITVDGQRAAQAAIAQGSGGFEHEVEAAIYATFRSRGAHMAFPPIVGSGANSTVLHYEQNSAKMHWGDLVVVDIGARLGAYCGDLTRTYPVGGEFSQRQRDVYNAVLAAHTQTVRSFRPGEETLKSLDVRCKELLKASPLRARDSSGKDQTLEKFMPHRVSHFLGLDVHDVGDPDPPLVPGCVITIEPGVYVPSEAIGVRLEDDYLVTESGLERIGPTLEKNADVVQAAMKATPPG
jgi:Xaa-Pro aminopeptidase